MLSEMKAKVFVQVPSNYMNPNESSRSKSGGEGDGARLAPGLKKHQLMKDSSISIIRSSNNLELENYDKYISDFHRFSSDIFDHSDHIFPPKRLEPAEVLRLKMFRSSANEYKITENFLKMTEGEKANLSPDRINKILKRLPDFR